MIKIERTKFPHSLVDPIRNDIEVFEVSSEEDKLFSKTKNYIDALKLELREKLSYNFKEPKFEILVVADETAKSFKLQKVIVLLENEEQKECVINALTEKNVVFGILENNDTEYTEIPTENKEQAKLWCFEVQKYLANSFDFKGTTRLKAAICQGELEAFDITVSGKGVNDDIVFAVKNISSVILTSKQFNMKQDDMYTFISNFFES